MGGQDFYFAYLVGYMGVLGICLGSLLFTMIQHVTRAGWSPVVRRLTENTAWTLPMMMLLFVRLLPTIPAFELRDLVTRRLDPKAARSGLANLITRT